jgi:uncharacterized protein
MMKKIVLAGGTGFIGKKLRHDLVKAGYAVIIVSRSSGDVNWDNQTQLREALEGADVLINLAGKSVNCRFTEKNKKELISSRIATTTALGTAIQKCTTPPKLWINASGASIYNENATTPCKETCLPAGKSFMAELAREWEKTFHQFRNETTRQVALRITPVLGLGGGVFPIFKLLSKFGLAGTLGNGKQKMSWIHLEDLSRIIFHVIENSEIKGALNCSAPHIPDNQEFMRTVRKFSIFPFGIPAPAFLIRAASPIIDVDSSLLLNSMWVYPEKLLQSNFQFKYPTLTEAFKNLNSENTHG